MNLTIYSPLPFHTVPKLILICWTLYFILLLLYMVNSWFWQKRKQSKKRLRTSIKILAKKPRSQWLYGNRVKYKIVSRCTKHLKFRVVSILLVLADLFVGGQHIHFALLDVQVDGSHHQPEVERQCHEGGTEQKEKKAAQYSSGRSHAEHDEQSGNGQTHQL